MDPKTQVVDCACVIHGSTYPWTYVENLYHGLRKNLSGTVRMHVFTEPDRHVPAHMIKHELTIWPDVRIGRAWWYKMQMFNPMHHSGNLLYLDLDTVITANIDWIVAKPTSYFWTVRDFKYLWRENHMGINSSVMWWDTNRFGTIWDTFVNKKLQQTQIEYRGDQDFLTAHLPQNQRRFFEQEQLQSWRWQCLDGGYDFDKRRHRKPGTGTVISPQTSILIFHGRPKQHEINDPTVKQFWDHHK